MLVRVFAVGVVTAFLSIPATPDHAMAGSDGRRTFDRFCKSWMGKLRQRHVDNERSVHFVKRGSRMVGEFTGYTSKAMECKAKPTGKAAAPYIGRIVYHEIRYGKEGSTAAKAKKAKPKELYRVEVTELFRYDGSAWKY
jgi:hypothetical protein